MGQALAVQVQGQGVVSADNLNTYQQTCDNVAALRAFVGAAADNVVVQVYMRGFVNPGDGGQGIFYWNPTGSAGDDGGITTIVPSGASTGEWARLGASNTGSIVIGPSVSVINNIPTFANTSGNLLKDSGIAIASLASLASLASPAFTGNPTAPTQSVSDNSTKLATTAMVQAALAASPSNAVPSGTIIAFAGSVVPSGWLYCYGQLVSTSTYAALYAVLGTTYGSGSGTFGIPDLRGRAVFGADAMGGTPANRLGSGNTGGIVGSAVVGATGGEQSHTLTAAEQASMSVTGTAAGNDQSTGDTFRGANTGGQGNSTPVNVSGTASGGGGAHNVLNPALVLNYLIKQ